MFPYAVAILQARYSSLNPFSVSEESDWNRITISGPDDTIPSGISSPVTINSKSAKMESPS